jgi:phosphopantothenoylcysteine decarboxylase/phosphopantothenate--cysteine ligase
VVGFAAETENIISHATQKRTSKGCDWIIANDVSSGTDTFGGDHNTINLITADGFENWPKMPKTQVAEKLALRIADALDQLGEG